MVKELARAWNEFRPSIDGNEQSEATTTVPVSAQVHRCVKNMVEKSSELKNQSTVGKQLALVLFRSLDRRQDEFIEPWIIDAFDSEYNFFVKRAHLAVSIDKIPTDEGLLEHFEAFERAFHSLVGPYFSGKEELDAILRDTNAAAD